MQAGTGGRTVVPDPPSRRPGVARMLACALVLLCGLTAGAAAEPPSIVSGVDADGYGRMVITFEKHVPWFEVSTSTGVMVVRFDEPLAPEVNRLGETLGRFINAARRDPDGRAIRLALARPVTVNTMEAGEKLFIDLLPMGWVGLPPGLPQEVVAELARRAEQAEERHREREMLEEYRTSKPVEVRLTSLPTFTRLVFVWDWLPEARIERTVDTVRIVFARPAKIELEGLQSRFPPYLRTIESRLGEKGLEVYLSVDAASPVRGFAEDSTFVVDVTAPEDARAGAAALDATGEEAAEGPSAAPEEPRELAPVVADAGAGRDRQSSEAPGGDADDMEATADDGGADEAGADGAGPVTVRPEARRFGSMIRLTLPFADPTPAAVFERANALWAVFGTRQPVDARLLRRELSGIVSSIDTWQSDGVTVMRMALAKPILSAVSGEATSWIITLGDAALKPGEPLHLSRELGRDGAAEAVVDFPTAAGIHDILDRQSGERFFAVTALAPNRAVPKPYNLVEFAVPKTIHGLVVVPIADDIEVAIADDGVRIVRARGLNLSQAGGAHPPGLGAEADASRPGFVDYFDDNALDPGAVYSLLARHVSETALAAETQRTAARVKMARALLGTDLGAEALAQLDLIEQDDPAALRDPSIRALRGIAMVMMQRPDEAIREFDAFGLSQSSDIALWRGIAEASRGNWHAARLALQAGEPALSTYSPVRRHQFRMAAARSALEDGDIANAAVRLAELGEAEDPATPDPELKLLNARLLAALGQKDEAIRAFDMVIAGTDRRLTAEAMLRRAETTQGSFGGEKPEQAIEALEHLAIAWRGDEIELGALRLLANLQARAGNFARAFAIMKSATLADADSATTRALQGDMNLVFEELFLGGEADRMAPVDALALYYDFRELTPVGRKGDQIIRNLADRMVEVDLLDQAGDLLRHQVDHRLKGAERAEIAARLAWVYLVNRKPADALVVLSRTRQAVLPREIAHQRLVLEARALAETGRTELALDLLSAASGPEIDDIRADVLWKGEHWQDAAEAFERSLETAWGSPEALSEAQRISVLRGAIAYALADDQLGLQRLRGKFLARMAESPDARAFDVVTMPMPATAAEFDELVRRIASTDTLDSFLEEYKRRYVLPGKANDKLASQS